MTTRTLLLKMAGSPAMRALVERRGWPLARRFVAGRTLEEAVRTVADLHARGLSAVLSHLGPAPATPTLADANAEADRRALAALQGTPYDAHLLVKPAQMGLAGDPDQAARRIAETAHRAGDRFIRLDMENSAVTGWTLALARRLRGEGRNVGVVVQAALRRSRADVNALNEQGIPVCLVKGGCPEPPEVAYADRTEVEENYFILTKMLLHSGTRPAFATHDEQRIAAAIAVAREELPQVARIAPRPNVDPGQWEFQMLYGVRRDLQEWLAAEGFGVRLYLPYGAEWYPYLMRRLAARPGNLAYFLRHLRRG